MNILTKKDKFMNCLVLGGNGFIGSHLVDRLLAEGHNVRVLDKYEEHYRKPLPSVDYQYGDFGNRGLLMEALMDIDVVFHLISTTLPKTSNDDPAFDVQSNVVETLFLLEQCTAQRVKKIIFISSGGTVYGKPSVLPIPEDSATDPECSYGITKLAIEKYLYLYWYLHGLDYCIFRLANAYGERQRPTATQGVIPVFLERALRNDEIVVWGDGSVIRDYVHVTDISSALIRALTYTGEFRIFNIGSGQGHSLSEVIDVIERATERSLQVKYTNGRSFDVPMNVLDISRAKNHLNWAPTISLIEGVTHMYAWMSKVYEG
jgi:UDP-glucose 4-epimerase